jgi:hypothetical protein
VLRLLPALAGTASVYALYVLQRRFFGRTTALLGALLLAVHPFAVAFSRILFVDALQSFCVIVGWLVIDRYMMESDRTRRRWLALEIVIVWAIAFILKYNAIVPAGIWIVAGWLGGRYTFRRSIAASFLSLAGPMLTLLLWPYDAPFWFMAYLRQGGNYDLGNAAAYYVQKLRLIFFGLTPVVTAIAIVLRFRRPSTHTRATAQFAIFAILYLLTVISLGRMFERYLLVVVPVLAMTVAGLSSWLYRTYRESTERVERLLSEVVLIVLAGVITTGMTFEYVRYAEYIDNDVDIGAVVQQTEALRGENGRVFWYAAEPIVGYYLGFTRDYSRALAIDTTASGRYNYFEGIGVPHSDDRTSYHVLDIRQFARRRGVGWTLSHSSQFLDSVRMLATRELPRVPMADYLNDSLVHTGDLVIVESGTNDIQGEPLLQKVDTNALPPMLDRLPTGRFDVIATFRPNGPAPLTDTIPTKYRAGVWILRKR